MVNLARWSWIMARAISMQISGVKPTPNLHGRPWPLPESVTPPGVPLTANGRRGAVRSLR
eukprot:5441384-Alexandrium_andersonii.AAC.1